VASPSAISRTADDAEARSLSRRLLSWRAASSAAFVVWTIACARSKSAGTGARRPRSFIVTNAPGQSLDLLRNDATVRSRRSWAMDVSVSARPAARRCGPQRSGAPEPDHRPVPPHTPSGAWPGRVRDARPVRRHRCRPRCAPRTVRHAELHRTEDHQFVSLSHRKGGRLTIDVDGEVGQCRGGHLCRTSCDRGLARHLEFGGSYALDSLSSTKAALTTASAARRRRIASLMRSRRSVSWATSICSRR